MTKAKIYYIHPCDIRATRDEKMAYLQEHKFKNIPFEHIQPDKNGNWIELTDNDWDELITVCSKDVKSGISIEALFVLYSLGVVTTRDDWAYDIDENNLSIKVNYFFDVYKSEQKRWVDSDKTQQINNFVKREIKWTSELEYHLTKGTKLIFQSKSIRKVLYRPFNKTFTYYEKVFTHRLYQQDHIFPVNDNTIENKVIGIMGNDSPKPFTVLSFDCLTDLNSLSPAAGGTKCLPFYRYTDSGEQIENITDWGLAQFREHYCLNSDSSDSQINMIKEEFSKTELNQDNQINQENHSSDISKEDIFHYIYAVLHNPAYRKKYELNLKREFPRIPFYENFWKWADWGKRLMDLHVNFEEAAPYPLRVLGIGDRVLGLGEENADSELNSPVPNPKSQTPKTKLKADKTNGTIIIDTQTTLTGIPKEVWEYKLGNRSAVEWILDQYKEKTPRDPTIREKFNTYKFADYKDKVIDLIKRVTTVSVETVKIVREME